MQIKIYEPETGEILTRADVANMKLPFEHGWDTWLVTSPIGHVLSQHQTYDAAALHLQILGPKPMAA